ncbi:MAG: isoaspartyl peptidase/L-asparaginase family protein [Anaerolineae bacterium]
MTIALIVHGGAWDIAQAEHPAHKNGCRAALLAGFDVLRGGGSALDAVETAIVDGATLQVGAVAAVERLQNPSRVARHLITSSHNMMVGEGAQKYARKHGFAWCAPDALVVERERRRWQQAIEQGSPTAADEFGGDDDHGTVGAVACDAQGNIAAGTSTGGTLFKPVGRVGDSPLPGCGYFAGNDLGGVSTTGHGESIIRVQLARIAADFCSRLHAPAAARAAISMLSDRVNGLGGLILIDHAGRIGFAYNTPHMARAYLTGNMDAPVVEI